MTIAQPYGVLGDRFPLILPRTDAMSSTESLLASAPSPGQRRTPTAKDLDSIAAGRAQVSRPAAPSNFSFSRASRFSRSQGALGNALVSEAALRARVQDHLLATANAPKATFNRLNRGAAHAAVFSFRAGLPCSHQGNPVNSALIPARSRCHQDKAAGRKARNHRPAASSDLRFEGRSSRQVRLAVVRKRTGSDLPRGIA